MFLMISNRLSSNINFNNYIISSNKNSKAKKDTTNKRVILTIWNKVINVFHLARPIQSFELLNQNKNNCCKAMIPYSLNQTGFKYFE